MEETQICFQDLFVHVRVKRGSGGDSLLGESARESFRTRAESDFFVFREERKRAGQMVKLTADVITEAAQSVNACRERELNLRSV